MELHGQRYEGPIYRPPSEASSLLVQATVGCPWNKCIFCMVYKNGPKFRIRKVEDIKEDIAKAGKALGDRVRTVFFPSGNTIIMKTEDLAEICRYTRETFPDIERITVYGSAQYVFRKGLDEMKVLAEAGLSRIHIGLESGDGKILERMKKGSTPAQQIEAGKIIKASGIELSEYVVLGLGGKERTKQHIEGTINVLDQIDPDFIRLRTLLPKANTPLLDEIDSGRFELLSPHGALKETYDLITGLDVTGIVASDHYTNYIYVSGKMPGDRESMLVAVAKAMKKDETSFRPVYVGTE